MYFGVANENEVVDDDEDMPHNIGDDDSNDASHDTWGDFVSLRCFLSDLVGTTLLPPALLSPTEHDKIDAFGGG